MHTQSQVGHVCATKHDGARGLHALDRRCINCRYGFSERGDSLCGCLTSNINIDLDGVRNAVKWTDWASLSERLVGRIGTSACLLCKHSNQCIDLWVHCIDSREVRIDYFPAGKLFTGNSLCKIECTLTPQFVRHLYPPASTVPNCVDSTRFGAC